MTFFICCTKWKQNSWLQCKTLWDLSLPLKHFVQLQLFHKATRLVTSAQGSFLSDHFALLCWLLSVFDAHQAPQYWSLHWSCLTGSVSLAAYRKYPLMSGCSLSELHPLYVSMMSGDRARSHVFCCMLRHIVRQIVYHSELGAVCGPGTAVFLWVGSEVQGWAYFHTIIRVSLDTEEWINDLNKSRVTGYSMHHIVVLVCSYHCWSFL